MSARANHIRLAATRRSAFVVLLAAISVVGCDDVPFASIELWLRQPEGLIEDRSRDQQCTGREDSCLQLSRSVDGGASEGVSLANDFRGPTGALPLGRQERRLDLEVFVGNPSSPTLLGRASPTLVPPIDAAGSDVTFARPVLLAKMQTVEALTIDFPAVSAAGAACADQAGNAWFLGGVSYLFTTATLEVKLVEPFTAQPSDSVACAGFAEPPSDVDELNAAREPVTGRYYAFVGDCGTGGGGELRSGVVDVAASVPIALGDGCDSLVAVRDDVVWVVQRNVVTRHNRRSLEQTNATNVFAAPPAPRVGAVVLADGSLLVAEENGDTTRYVALEGGGVDTSTEQAIGAVRLMLHEDNAWALTGNERLFNLDADPWRARELSLADVSSITDATMLGDGSVVVLSPEGVAVEGEVALVPTLQDHGRFAITTTVGSALLLWGGSAGIDVLVPSRPALLESR